MMLQGVVCRCNTEKCDHEECLCNGWERFRDGIKLPYPEHFILAKNNTDDKGFLLCRYCGKLHNSPGYLVECPECGKKFRGPRPHFPIDYECEDCE